MATYVMADIHGCYNEFMDMLNLVQFDPARDRLIIAGDIVDRGEDTYKMLKYMDSRPKGVTFLAGNHDLDFAKYCEELLAMKEASGKSIRELATSAKYEDLYERCVIDHYGTLRKLIKARNITEQDLRRWIGRIRKMHYTKYLRVNNRDYIIVHAGYISKEDFEDPRNRFRLRNYKDIEQFYVWAREDSIQFGKDDATIVFGHTPTIAGMIYGNNGTVFFAEYDSRRFYNIDCGCVFRSSHYHGNLACLRLDDEKIFYLYEVK